MLPRKIVCIFAVSAALALAGCASGGGDSSGLSATDAGLLIGGGFGAVGGALIDQSNQQSQPAPETTLECRSNKGEVIRPEGNVFAPREGWTCSWVKLK